MKNEGSFKSEVWGTPGSHKAPQVEMLLKGDHRTTILQGKTVEGDGTVEIDGSYSKSPEIIPAHFMGE